MTRWYPLARFCRFWRISAGDALSMTVDQHAAFTLVMLDEIERRERAARKAGR